MDFEQLIEKAMGALNVSSLVIGGREFWIDSSGPWAGIVSHDGAKLDIDEATRQLVSIFNANEVAI